MNIEDDFFYLPPKDLNFKRRKNIQNPNKKNADNLSQHSGKQHREHGVVPVYKGSSEENSKRMKFSMIGQSVIASMSASNASRSSISSQAKQK